MTIQNILKKSSFNENNITKLLNADNKNTQLIFDAANNLREKIHGKSVFLRGIIEFSNYCSKNCNYCGINAASKSVNRYRISEDEILEACKFIEKMKMTTVVLQSGEDPGYSIDKLVHLIKKIKKHTNLAITLSIGEFSKLDYKKLYQAGADRFLLRYETSDIEIFNKCHPDDDFQTRITCLKHLKEVGFQVGSGILIGLPGQTIEKLAKEIIYLTNLKLDMIGCGPFMPDDRTTFSNQKNTFDNETLFKTIAIIRLLNPKAHIPATTAFDALEAKSRIKLLQIGANVFMPNATPEKYKKDYLLYPNKPSVDMPKEDGVNYIINQLSKIGRNIGQGHGHSIL